MAWAVLAAVLYHRMYREHCAHARPQHNITFCNGAASSIVIRAYIITTPLETPGLVVWCALQPRINPGTFPSFILVWDIAHYIRLINCWQAPVVLKLYTCLQSNVAVPATLLLPAAFLFLTFKCIYLAY
jgi:hypothetical protein